MSETGIQKAVGRIFVDQLTGKRTAVLNRSASELSDMTLIYASPVQRSDVRDRDADRLRFPDPLFNKWLDESVTENGEYSVWHQVGDTCSAWHGWENSSFYAQPIGNSFKTTTDEMNDIVSAGLENLNEDDACDLLIEMDYLNNDGVRNAALEAAAEIFDAPVRAVLLNSDVCELIRALKSTSAQGGDK